MRVVVQRVLEAFVKVNGKTIGKISQGLLVLCGFENEDNKDDLEWMTNKLINLRIFNDSNGVMNNSIKEVDGEFLVVSQFTLHASTKKGNRPSYIKAAKPEISILLYDQFVHLLRERTGKKIETGEFGADMKVSLMNDGPVTIIIDSKQKEL